MSAVLLFLSRYWIHIAVGVLFAASASIFIDWRHQSARIGELETQLVESAGLLSTARATLAAQERAVLAAQEAASAAARRREQIIKNQSQQLNKLRAQRPPDECAAAIEWGIERRGDLQWPQD